MTAITVRKLKTAREDLLARQNESVLVMPLLPVPLKKAPPPTASRTSPEPLINISIVAGAEQHTGLSGF